MKSFVPLSSRSLNTLLTGLVLALVVILALAAWLMPAPQLRIAYQDSVVEVFADRAWVLLPGDCARISWEFDSVFPIHIDGVEWRESGEQQFCPTISASALKVEYTDQVSSEYRSYKLNIFYMPHFALNLVGVLLIPFLALFGLQYLWVNDIRRPPLLRVSLGATVFLGICVSLLRMLDVEFTVVGVLATLRNVFSDRRWQVGSAIVAAVFYASLAFWSVVGGVKNRRNADFLAVGGFFLVVLLLYLPHGFAMVGQWDEWTYFAYLENMPWPRMESELTLRPFSLVASTISIMINSGSFVGFNLVYALLLWARPTLLYVILRQIGLRYPYAYLIALLCFVYPVDARLMSLQSLNLQFSFVSLLTAIFIALRYAQHSTRFKLCGMWLAMSLCIIAYETAYALVLVLPILWNLRTRQMNWQNLNLSLIWYIIPIAKLLYILLLISTSRPFYQSDFFSPGSGNSLNDILTKSLDNLIDVYVRTFAVSWGESFHFVDQNPWLYLVLLILVLIGTISWQYWRHDKCVKVLENKLLGFNVVVGLLLILPSVAILISIDHYIDEVHGLYLYIAVPATIAVFGLIALLTSPIANNRYRNSAITCLCLLLMLPSLSRLFLQHEYYVTSANNKARILAQIAQMAPAIGNETRILVVSDMTDEEFRDKNIEAFTSSALGHALYVVYGGQGSGRGSICPSMDSCFPLKNRTEFLVDTIVFRMDQELNLELISEPQIIFEEFVGLDYDVSKLFDAEASIPMRAFSMLGLSKE